MKTKARIRANPKEQKLIICSNSAHASVPMRQLVSVIVLVRKM